MRPAPNTPTKTAAGWARLNARREAGLPVRGAYTHAAAKRKARRGS